MVLLFAKKVKIMANVKSVSLQKNSKNIRRKIELLNSKVRTAKQSTANTRVVKVKSQKTDRYIVFSKNNILYIAYQKDGQIQDVTPLTKKSVSMLESGSQLVIKPQGMSRVQIASVMEAVLNPLNDMEMVKKTNQK